MFILVYTCFAVLQFDRDGKKLKLFDKSQDLIQECMITISNPFKRKFKILFQNKMTERNYFNVTNLIHV